VITGAHDLLPYVRDRAGEDGVPLVRTALGTVEAAGAIESLFAATPFKGGEAKLARLDELLGGADLAALTV
jgi:hypothetical protein